MLVKKRRMKIRLKGKMTIMMDWVKLLLLKMLALMMMMVMMKRLLLVWKKMMKWRMRMEMVMVMHFECQNGERWAER